MDITRFHAAFFEESREGLDAMESGLLGLESGFDADTVNVVFRAAHSIKGGSATFGFTAIAELTHLLETLLDEARSALRVLDGAAVSALLASVDALRMLLAAAEHGDAVDQSMLLQARAGLERMLDAPGAQTPVAAATANTPGAAPDANGWRINFAPERSLFLSGNDPLRILRELAQLGQLTVACRDDALPPFGELDPFEAWLAWDMELLGDVKRTAVESKPPERKAPRGTSAII